MSAPSFLDALAAGRIDWAALQPFPEPDPAEQAAADEVVDRLGAFLASRIDAEEVDRTGALPPGLFRDLRAERLLDLRLPPELGGRGLGAYATFRAIERAATVSVAAGQSLAMHNGIGVGLIPLVLPFGPLRAFVRQRMAAGFVSGWADTEPAGQNNQWPSTTLTPTADGTAYLLTGEKLFAGNGPIAELLGVTATVVEPTGRRLGLAVVDTGRPGVRVVAEQQFMGVRGLPAGMLRFTEVRVPREHVLAGNPDDPRLSPVFGAMMLVGRNLITSAPALAIARSCLRHCREFVGRRSIDGRGLGTYDEIQRMLAASLADVFAMESVIRWSLLGSGLPDRTYERLAAKNICATACWRVVDRTMSLLGGEGYETAASKRDRGADDAPLERLFRDARGLRITGNVDFQLDNQAGRLLLATCRTVPDARQPALVGARAARLSPANRAHLDETARQVRQFTRVCAETAVWADDPAKLPHREHTLILLARIASELFTMWAVLARASQSTNGEPSAAQDLAHVHCTAARHRLADLWRRLDVNVCW